MAQSHLHITMADGLGFGGRGRVFICRLCVQPLILRPIYPPQEIVAIGQAGLLVSSPSVKERGPWANRPTFPFVPPTRGIRLR